MSHLYKTFEPKDEEETLDYLFDWAGESNNNGLTDWLESGETIETQETTVDAALTLISSEIVNGGTAVLMWISEGVVNNTYEIRCKVTTSSGRIAIRTALLPIQKR